MGEREDRNLRISHFTVSFLPYLNFIYGNHQKKSLKLESKNSKYNHFSFSKFVHENCWTNLYYLLQDFIRNFQYAYLLIHFLQFKFIFLTWWIWNYQFLWTANSESFATIHFQHFLYATLQKSLTEILWRFNFMTWSTLVAPMILIRLYRCLKIVIHINLCRKT